MPHATPSARLSRRDVIRGLAAAGIGTAAGAAAHGFLYERHRIEVTRATLAVSGLPDAIAGFRIGLLTDLHCSASVPVELIRTAVDLIMADRPDVIVLGGDYVTWGDRRFVEPAASLLAPLSAPHGVIAILGNHDDDRDMPAALAAGGATVLRDQRTQLTVRGEPLDFAGIRYWTRKAGDVARVVRGASPHLVLLAHTPHRLVEAAALGIPLMLSGHTHGGQIVLPGLGAVAARRFPIVAGTGRLENTTVFVSRGVGTVYLPLRINCPPEVAILTLAPTSTV